MVGAGLSEVKQPAIVKEPRSYQLEIFQEACNRNVGPVCDWGRACCVEAGLQAAVMPHQAALLSCMRVIWKSRA